MTGTETEGTGGTATVAETEADTDVVWRLKARVAAAVALGEAAALLEAALVATVAAALLLGAAGCPRIERVQLAAMTEVEVDVYSVCVRVLTTVTRLGVA